MNDNLPDIEFKEKKEKKGGAIGWLRGKMGMGSKGSIGGAGVNPAAMNAGKASLNLGKFGAAAGGGKFGASAGLAGLLAGKGGVIATVAMVAVASGMYLANNAPTPSTGTAAFSSEMSGDKYVPAILRSQAANQGSSLEMFKDTNKGSLAMEAAPEKPAEPKDGPAADASAEAEAQPAEPAAPGGDMAQDMMAKLQGGNMASLTSQLGGGSNKFSGMGGFGNKHNTGATGNKLGFTSGIGAGFQQMPKFDQRKQKMLAMKGVSKAQVSKAAAAKKGNIGAGAFNQAKGMREIQKSYTGDTADGARSTQDKAWEGTTADGAAGGGGAGLSDGGAGIVTSPSLDNVGSSGGGGGAGVGDDPVTPEVTSPTDVSPWQGLPQQAMMYILVSAVLSAIGAYLITLGRSTTWAVGVGALLQAMGYILCIAALGLGVMALINGIKIMGEHGQALMGTVYTLGGGVAIAGAIFAMATGNAAKSGGMTKVLWMSAITGVMGLLGSMLGGA